MTRLFVVRHGNTFEAGEEPRRVGARSDLALTGQGRAQALALGRHLRAAGVGFVRAFTSPLRRCTETASIILSCQPPGVPCEGAPLLLEIDHGVDEGETEAAVLARVGGAAIARWDAGGEPPEGWVVDADRRMADWPGWLAALPAGDVLAVTSNGAARFALRAVGAEPGRSQKLATGAYGVLRRTSAGPFAVDAWNVRP